MFEVHAHRGLRSHFPENSIEAIRAACEHGLGVVEIDVQVTKDLQLMVCHDPVLRLSSDGQNFEISVYQTNLEEFRSYRFCPELDERFPDQTLSEHRIPSLSEVIGLLKNYPEMRLNLELKSDFENDYKNGIEPSKYSEIVLRELESIDNSLLIQSFDIALLNELHAKAPTRVYGVLVEHFLDIDATLKELFFKPDYFNPDHVLLTSADVTYLHSLGLKVIPWTINEPSIIRQFIEMNVDGIISDYPLVVRDLL